MEFNYFGIRFTYFMVVKLVLLNFNMPVDFSIRESDNKYRNIDSWKLAQKMIVNSKLKNLFFLLEWVRVTDFNRK